MFFEDKSSKSSETQLLKQSIETRWRGLAICILDWINNQSYAKHFIEKAEMRLNLKESKHTAKQERMKKSEVLNIAQLVMFM